MLLYPFSGLTDQEDAESSVGFGRIVGRNAGLGLGGVSAEAVVSATPSVSVAGPAGSAALAGFIVGRKAGLGAGVFATGSTGVGTSG